MRWSIDFPIPSSPFPISHSSKVLSLGSCFAQTIGKKMREAKFDVLINPFGTLFHPLNLTDLLKQAVPAAPMNPAGIVEREGLFVHYAAHSDVRGDTRAELEENFTRQMLRLHHYLKEASHLVLTLGTAWIYMHKEFGRVANCHKQPADLFEKKLSTLEELVAGLGSVLEALLQGYPNLQIILTLSPVRHTKEGISENQLSKSLLRVLCAQLEQQLEAVTYFPAYEILVDELRDYRFYKADLVHPTEEAENYIWKKWQQAIFMQTTQQKVAEIQKIQLELAHRSLNPDSEAHRKFLQNILGKLERLQDEFDFSEEIQDVKSRLQR
ncbi:MAG: GSCFA domain-containing protein [Bacteroidetes bacterium]|nr:GSCFA domain-containing protein [Bacteroidota bacterium]MDA1268280.1 GSCFA domain-containing protein [Bacteroidota bacterium]